MCMRHHIYRHAIHAYIHIGAMIYIKATQEHLFCFTAALVLGDKQARYQPKYILCTIYRPQLQIYTADGTEVLIFLSVDNHIVHLYACLLQEDVHISCNAIFNNNSLPDGFIAGSMDKCRIVASWYIFYEESTKSVCERARIFFFQVD